MNVKNAMKEVADIMDYLMEIKNIKLTVSQHGFSPTADVKMDK